jgi:hypothetical protein
MTETLVQPGSDVMPMEVRRAVGVLWLSLLLACIGAIIADWNRVSREGFAFAVFIQIFSYGLWALLIWKISQGRRWARITWLVLFACGALAIVFLALGALGGSKTAANYFDSPFSAAIVVVQTAIQSYATVLLFSRTGGTWFLQKQ